jgi:hypothetical protein
MSVAMPDMVGNPAVRDRYLYGARCYIISVLCRNEHHNLASPRPLILYHIRRERHRPNQTPSRPLSLRAQAGRDAGPGLPRQAGRP